MYVVGKASKAVVVVVAISFQFAINKDFVSSSS
jgi:hypothetical protein